MRSCPSCQCVLSPAKRGGAGLPDQHARRRRPRGRCLACQQREPRDVLVAIQRCKVSGAATSCDAGLRRAGYLQRCKGACVRSASTVPGGTPHASPSTMLAARERAPQGNQAVMRSAPGVRGAPRAGHGPRRAVLHIQPADGRQRAHHQAQGAALRAGPGRPHDGRAGGGQKGPGRIWCLPPPATTSPMHVCLHSRALECATCGTTNTTLLFVQ